MVDFFKTGMGRTYYESTLPGLVKAITRLAVAIEASNDILLRGFAPVPATPEALRELTPEEIVAHPGLSDEQIREALERGRREQAEYEYATGMSTVKPVPVDGADRKDGG